MDVCDPDAKMKNIRKLIKLHTGRSVKLSRDKTCDIIRDTKSGSLPLPPLVLTRDKKYLLDDKSPLKQKDYELLFRSDTKSSVMKRLAKKVGLIEVDKTKVELKRAIGRRLASMNVREPILLPGGRREKRATFSDEIEENIKSDSESEVETNENNSTRNANANANTRENNSARNASANVSRNTLISNKELRSTLAKKRHMDRLKALSKVKTSSGSVSSSANTRVVENAQRKVINAQKAVRNAERETRLRVHEAETRGTLQRRRARRIMENTIRRSRIETNNALNRARRERRERNILNRDARKAERELYREREMALRYKRDFKNIRKQEKKLRENLDRQISMTENQISAIKADTRKMLTKQKVVSGLKSLAAKKQIDEAVKSAENLQKSLNNTKQNLEKTRFEQESAIKQVKELEEKLKSSVNVNSQVKLRKELENAKSKIANLEERQKTAASNLQTEAKKFDFLKMKYEAAKTQMNTNALAIKKAAENRNAAIAAASEKAKAELNEIRRDKEKALEEAAANKAKAIEEAKNATKKAAMANTQRERNQAKRNIENAQAKIRAANANKAQALAAAKKSENEARKALVATRFQSAAQKARADQALKNAEEKRLRNISAQKIQNAIRARKARENEMRRVREDAKRKIQNAQRRSTIDKPNARGNTLQKKETTNLKNRENRERRQREIQLQKQKNALEVQEREKKEREKKMAELKAAANAKAAENAKTAAEAREMERKKRNFDIRLSKESILTNNNKTELRARGTFNVRNIEQIKRVRMANTAKKMEMEKKRREQDKQREQRKKALLNVEKQLERATNLTKGNKDELKKRFFRGELKPDDIGKRREQRRLEKYVQNATLLPPTRKKTYMEDIRKPGTNLQSLRALLNAEIRLRSKRSNSKPVMKNNPLFQPNMKKNPVLSLKQELHDLIEIKFPMKSDGCKRGKRGLHNIVKNANTKQELEDLKKPTSAFMKSITRRERQGWCQERPKWR